MSELELASEDELLAQLDRLLNGTDDQMTGREFRAAIDRARRFVDIWLARHRERLCGESKVRDAVEGDGILELATIVDIAVTTGLDQPCATVLAAIIVKRGIKALCKDHAEPST